MANSRMTEGVGKKIVEALKMESDVEISPTEEPVITEDTTEKVVIDNTYEENIDEFEENQVEISENEAETSNFELDTQNYSETYTEEDDLSPFEQFAALQDEPIKPMNNFNTASDFDGYEMPSNVAVLKQLITKLPAGVTKQTGAIIIKQTMEALGISMRSVLQEAQQVQENLNNSAKECHASIVEHKKQIGVLEKQAQKYQRQYAALNDVISVFVQTSI